MRLIEQSGKSVEDATREALAALGVSQDEVEVEVLEEGSRGFLGLHATEARVRVTVLSREEPDVPFEEAEEPAASTEEAGEVARDVLERIVHAMGLEAEVKIETLPDGTYRLEVVGEDMGVVIGRHGQTINALQYLVGLITHKKTGEKVRVLLDAEGYRSRREQLLHDLADNYARQVKETGQEAVLDALHAFERRIIHTALADDPDVRTYSEGEEPERRVVISPRRSD